MALKSGLAKGLDPQTLVLPMSLMMFFCLLFLAQEAVCAEEYDLTNSQTVPSPSAAEDRHWIIRNQRNALQQEEHLPEGYRLTSRGDLVIYDGVTFFADGRIETPQGLLKPGKLPRDYSRLPHGAILTPDGLVLELSQPEAKPRQAEEATKNKQEPQKPENLPKQTALWEMLPLTEANAQKSNETPKEQGQTQRPSPSKPKSQKLTIPKQALASKDLSFLKGCWESRDLPAYLNIWHDAKKQGRLTRVQVCFNDKGQGTIRYFDHGTCNGKVKAQLKAHQLNFQSSQTPCPDGTRFAVRNFACYGSGSDTQCAVLAHHKSIIRRSLVHFNQSK